MENGPFEDGFPIENGDIPASYVSFPEGILKGSVEIFFSVFCFVFFLTTQEEGEEAKKTTERQQQRVLTAVS